MTSYAARCCHVPCPVMSRLCVSRSCASCYELLLLSTVYLIIWVCMGIGVHGKPGLQPKIKKRKGWEPSTAVKPNPETLLMAVE